MHLDLKPENIMFKSQDLSKIALVDFGISNFYKENLKAKIHGMTPFYCPPEIKFSDDSIISPKADIFSFGMLFILFFLFFLLSLLFFRIFYEIVT